MSSNAKKADPQFILDNSELLLPWCCEIVDGSLYEVITFDDFLFKKEEFVNSKHETYYLEGDDHVYRVFLSVDDYDYVTDINMVKRLNIIFNKAKLRVENGVIDAD